LNADDLRGRERQGLGCGKSHFSALGVDAFPFAVPLHNVSTIPESASPASKVARMAHMRHLVDQLKNLEERLRAGGGPAKIERQHRAGKLTARERIAALADEASFREFGLLSGPGPTKTASSPPSRPSRR